jgi:prolyl-tRNA synthetase
MTKKSQEGLTVKKEENFSEWFTQLMVKAELAEYSKISGFIAYRPLAYALWEKIKQEVDKEFKKIGYQNIYFPLLIPESLFEKEKNFVKGFSPEVAWVTEAGNTKLPERLAIRPTSEAVMYDAFTKWVRSWRDLPMIYNQWGNVVRWDTNNPVPFFRGREFLWNECHTVFATQKEAIEHGEKTIKAYNKVTQKIMAMPAIYGKKTESEKFAGSVFSKKNHVLLPNGKVLEGTCFHHDGQNFSKAYEIKFKNKEGHEDFVWQNTHAISTRDLGGMLALHSDNKGVVIPPKIAPNKIVIIPLLFEKEKKVLAEAKRISKNLSKFNPFIDNRLEVTPGYKFNEWELKGVPLRVEIGPRDIKSNSAIVVKRNTGEKTTIKIKDLKKEIPKILEKMQEELYSKARKILKSNQETTEDKKELIKLIKNKKMVKVPMCKDTECEDQLKSDTSGASTLFIDPKETSTKNKKCIICNKDADYWIYAGKTY